jgi:hypothetical protein
MGDTAAMWGDMLGLGPLMKAVSDPTFHDQIRGFLGAMQATHALAAECIVRCDRLERKLCCGYRGSTRMLSLTALESDPPFLRNTEPMEPEDMPLQLALVTMELAELRHRVALLEARGQDHATGGSDNGCGDGDGTAGSTGVDGGD